jgi:hypothetical protein
MQSSRQLRFAMDKLLRLREEMARQHVNAYIIPSEDAHQVFPVYYSLF